MVDYFKYNNGYKQYIKLELSSVIEAVLNNLMNINAIVQL